MKVILTGSTGFIGSEVLQQCLQSQAITSVIALVRRGLPSTLADANPKLKVVIMEDFTVYPDHVLQELKGAEACIWCLGKAIVPTDEEARKISFDFTLAAARACNQAVSFGTGKKLRFVYLSGKIAERDQTKSLWYMDKHRKMRGQLEMDLISFANNHQNAFETYIAKPSMVLSKEGGLLNMVSKTLIPTVGIDVLANAMIKIAVGGNKNQTFENSDLNVLGK